jgi:hypothetical protein
MVFMTRILFLYLFFIFLNCNPALADNSVCSNFFPKLSEIPHIKLTQTNDGFKSLRNGKWTQGCEIVFKTHESIVSGDKVYNTFQSFINAPGWTIDNKLSADGPGSSSVTIESDKNKCAIFWSQHAWVDEKIGEHRQSSDIEIIIQCSSK